MAEGFSKRARQCVTAGWEEGTCVAQSGGIRLRLKGLTLEYAGEDTEGYLPE